MQMYLYVHLQRFECTPSDSAWNRPIWIIEMCDIARCYIAWVQKKYPLWIFPFIGSSLRNKMNHCSFTLLCRRIRKATRRSTFTPPPAPKTVVPTPPNKTPEASSSSFSPAMPSSKRASRSASKTLQTVTPTPCLQDKTQTPEPVTATKTRSSTGKKSASGSAGRKTKKTRRGTFDKSPAQDTPKDAPQEEAKSSSSLKEEIMAEIDRKVQLQVASESSYTSCN